METFSNFPIINEENRYLALIEDSVEGSLNCSIIDEKADKIVFSFLIDDIQQFINSVPTLFKKSFKAVIFEVFNYHLLSPYQNNHEFCQTLKAKFAEIQIQTYFLTKTEWLLARSLIHKKYTTKLNNIISIIMVSELLGIVTDYIFTRNGYKILSYHKFSVTILKNIQKIILQRNPKAVFLIETKNNTVADLGQKYSEI
uniref:Uncharacterized protein n=1 Tax=Panagrolaimus superbus TaxID=310955 RepID=A0A914XUD7_9BILA